MTHSSYFSRNRCCLPKHMFPQTAVLENSCFPKRMSHNRCFFQKQLFPEIAVFENNRQSTARSIVCESRLAGSFVCFLTLIYTTTIVVSKHKGVIIIYTKGSLLLRIFKQFFNRKYDCLLVIASQLS